MAYDPSGRLSERPVGDAAEWINFARLALIIRINLVLLGHIYISFSAF